jgi:hypothetical protein
LIELFKEARGRYALIQLDEDLVLNLLGEVPDVNLAVKERELALPLDGFDDHLLGELTLLLRLNVQLENEGSLFAHDDPDEELETAVVVFAVD